MPGIINMTVDQLRRRICDFDRTYVDDWNAWLVIRRNDSDHIAPEFGRILRKWQACRPNRMRRCREEADHDEPYLEHLLCQSREVLAQFDAFELRSAEGITERVERVLGEAWNIFQHLSYRGRARNGLAGVVGISKAVLLLTEGRVGPAFDSEVRTKLETGNILNVHEWLANLRNVANDIAAFERLNRCTLLEAAPQEFSHLHYGRLYDMLLGPGTPGLT